MTMFLFVFFVKHLKALNGVWFVGGSWSLEKFWHKVSAVSNSLDLIKDISSLHKSSRFMSRKSDSKGSKSMCIQSIQSLMKKVSPLYKTFFRQQIHTKKKRLISQDYDYHWKYYLREDFSISTFKHFKALKNLTKNKSIVIQKAGKCNTVLILDKCSNIKAIKEILHDNTKVA